MQDCKSVGCIGLGLLGSAMTDRLMEHDYRVVGFDIDDNRRNEFARRGGEAVKSATHLLTVDPVLLSLPNSDIVEQVIDELVTISSRPRTIIDTTTGHPDRVAEVGRRLAKMGIDYLDATVGGSSLQAANGDAIIMCGGPPDAFERHKQVLDVLAKQSFHLGKCGSGARMKLVMNLVLGLNRAVLAEGLGYAQSLDLDLESTLQILQAGPSQSRAMETKGRKMLDGDFKPQARLAQHLKDVRLILETGQEANAHLPLSSLHCELLENLVADGYGTLDNSAILKRFTPHS